MPWSCTSFTHNLFALMTIVEMANDGGGINAAVTERRVLVEGVDKHILADWKDSAALFVRQELFNKKQFVSDEELVYGGKLQKYVCEHLNISSANRSRMFWDDKGGKEAVRNTFRRKRQAAQCAMKLAFRGKYNVGGKLLWVSSHQSQELKNATIFQNIAEWMTKTSMAVATQNPPGPEEFAAELRQNQAQYTEFADRMIRAVHGKSRYNAAAEVTLFDTLISKSQEAFTLLLYENGYKNWMWAWQNHQETTSDTNSDGTAFSSCPAYEYTTRHQDFTSRNGGWSREGMLKFNALYKRVEADRATDAGAFEKVYKRHREDRSTTTRKRRRGGTTSPLQILTISDDLGDLLTEDDNVTEV